jgi:hypothetical protein
MLIVTLSMSYATYATCLQDISRIGPKNEKTRSIKVGHI